jgi:hypothetical protein
LIKTTLLLISSRLEDQAFANDVARLAKLRLLVVDDPNLGVEAIQKGEVATIWVGVNDQDEYLRFEKMIDKNFGIFSDKISPNSIHYLSPPDLQSLGFLVQSPLFGNFVTTKFNPVLESATHYAKIIEMTLAPRAFDIQKTFGTHGKLETINFDNTRQKQSGVEKVKEYLLRHDFKSRMADIISNSVDELIMNAMFDAPIDERGRRIYSRTPRDTEIELNAKQKVQLNYGVINGHAVVNVVDLFGSLNKAELFNRMAKRYVEEEYKVVNSYAGAGIGLATVFRSGGSFLFVSEPGVRTEVTVFFKKTDNFKDFKDQFRFISTQFYLG